MLLILLIFLFPCNFLWWKEDSESNLTIQVDIKTHVRGDSYEKVRQSRFLLVEVPRWKLIPFKMGLTVTRLIAYRPQLAHMSESLWATEILQPDMFSLGELVMSSDILTVLFPLCAEEEAPVFPQSFIIFRFCFWTFLCPSFLSSLLSYQHGEASK